MPFFALTDFFRCELPRLLDRSSTQALLRFAFGDIMASSVLSGGWKAQYLQHVVVPILYYNFQDKDRRDWAVACATEGETPSSRLFDNSLMESVMVRILFNYSSFLFHSLSPLSRSITTCLHSLTPHNTSLTITQSSIDTTLTLLLTIQVLHG